MDITDGIVSSVFHRELEKNYGPVPPLPTESPLNLQTEYSVGNLVAGIYFFWRSYPSVCHSEIPSVFFVFLLPT
jgi:hypothetical protein